MALVIAFQSPPRHPLAAPRKISGMILPQNSSLSDLPSFPLGRYTFPIFVFPTTKLRILPPGYACISETAKFLLTNEQTP